MKCKYLFFLSIVLGLIFTSCSGGGVQASPTPLPTATAEPTQIPQPTQPPKPTKVPDLTEAQLTVNDLPNGYRQLSDEEVKSMKFDAVEKSFGGVTGGAPGKAIVFVNQSQNDFGLVISFLAHPLSTQLITGLAAVMSQPAVAAKDLLGSMQQGTEKVAVKPEYSGIGDGSIGITGKYTSGVLFDAILAYRNDSFMVTLYMYTSTPKIDLKVLTQKLDERVTAAFK